MDNTLEQGIPFDFAESEAILEEEAESRKADFDEGIDGEYLDLIDSGWSIKDDNTADWALKTVQAERQELERLKDIATKQIAEIDEKIASAQRRCDHRTQYLLFRLREYFDTVPHKETKTQTSYQLLSGKLIYKKPVSSIRKGNETHLLDYVKQASLNEFIETKEVVKWSDFRKRLTIIEGQVVDTETGDTVSGVEIEEKPEKFDVK